MSTHTPGPWRAEGPDDEPYGAIGVFAGSHLVCELWQDDAPVPEYNAEQWANARLIAAAPDLLHALKGVIANHCANDKIFCGTCTDARRVIAKAEGK